MSDVTRILSQIESGDPSAAEKLMPLVYEELRKLAAARLALEKPGQTLQATALVHDAYLRLVDVDQVQRWDSRGHFFCAAAEAMRRILVDNARRRESLKRGGDDVLGRARGNEGVVFTDGHHCEYDRDEPRCKKMPCRLTNCRGQDHSAQSKGQANHPSR